LSEHDAEVLEISRRWRLRNWKSYCCRP